MNGSQRFAVATVGLFMLGVVAAIHYDSARHARAMTNASLNIVPVRDEMRPALEAKAPMSLTASDGSGLKMVKMWGRAVVSDPLAFTELHLEFENPRDRIIEGQFSITLPPGSTVSRFAMKLPTGWQEGEMVEKQAARRAYEDFLHRRQDPALLEQAAGNAFSARVFPIPANGTKELIVSYTQELRGWQPYVLPLRGLPEIGSIDLAATLEGSSAPAKTLTATKLLPTEDFGLAPGFVRPTPGLRSDNLVLARIRPVPSETPDPIGSAAILFDTSASRALGFGQQVELVSNLVHDIAEHGGPSTPIVVAAFDQKTDVVFDGKASDFGDAALESLKARGALGASNLQAALAWAKGAKKSRLIVITDGVPTAGETDADKITAAASDLGESGVQRIDAIAVGGIRDEALLRHLTVAGLARDGAVMDGQLTTASMSRRLNAATRSGIKVSFEGARWSYPESLDGVQAGDERFVYADIPEDSPVRAVVDGVTIPLDLQHVERPLLERAWVQAKIDSILEKERTSGPKPETTKEIIDLSVRNRVMSPYTALLVLETDQDYARFNIDRHSLADILVVDNGTLGLMHRSDVPELEKKKSDDNKKTVQKNEETTAANRFAGPIDTPATTPSNDPATADPSPAPDVQTAPIATATAMALDTPAAPPPGAAGLDAIGTLGHGAGTGTGQGFGNGHGRLGGAHAVAAPTLRQGQTTVSGALPAEVIQRIVRQNFGRFRLCYENGLRANPSLQGQISTRFTIGSDGTVRDVRDAGSTLPDQGVATCVRRGFENLSFPQPASGVVTVVYPIVFSPGTPGMPQNGPPAYEKPTSADPYTGKFQDVMGKLGTGANDAALDVARKWNKDEPGDVMALIALGETYEARKDFGNAERAYGSLVDLFPSRADMRRFAGVRLERISENAATDLAIDTFEKAEKQRPDHPESHRLVAFAHLRRGEYDKAFEAGVRGVQQKYPSGRFLGVDQILREDLGLIGAAWSKAEPKRADEIQKKVKDAGGSIEDAPSIRFVLDWETDANDVDFHIFDDQGGHAFYSAKHLPSGGDLYADVTTGYGPECFTIRLPKDKRANLYTLQANYYSRGPMGYGMGKLEIIDHDGKGNLTFQERPYVVMVDHAFVNLGTVSR